MSWWTRLTNVFRGDRLNREIDEELDAHIQEAIELGRSEAEARRAFGSLLRQREASRDVRVLTWLDSLRSDLIYGWRQIVRKKAASSAAVLSLGLALGACTAAFRLVNALFWRPLPVAHAGRIYAFGFENRGDNGQIRVGQSGSYPMLRQLQDAVSEQADLIGNDYVGARDISYTSSLGLEKAFLQHVSASMFEAFDLQPALGRVLAPSDDAAAGASPVAVLSYDYWTRRFGRDPAVIGRTFRFDRDWFTIVGVAQPPFTGTEPGKLVDIFVPLTMNAAAVPNPDWNWLRTLVVLKPGASADQVRERLDIALRAFREAQVNAHSGATPQIRAAMLSQRALLEPSPSGMSDLQRMYRRPLEVLSVLVALVLLIACANVANLMTAQGSARAREMALRVSIGAGRGRLAQMVLAEGAILALCGTGLGAAFAAWASPLVVSRINPADDPARLQMSPDWRVAAFGIGLTFAVTLLFGLLPALRASSVQPVSALKGGYEPRSRRRSMHLLIGAQSAFCFLVLLVSGLFGITLRQLMHQPLGFSAQRMLVLSVATETPPTRTVWDQLTERIRELPGVESAAISIWPVLSGAGWDSPVSANGSPPGQDSPEFLAISPGWLAAMKIPLLGGRDFRPEDTYPAVAIVNQSFAMRYFAGEDPVGRSFEVRPPDGTRLPVRIIGLAGDARFSDLHDRLGPGVYFPFDAKGGFVSPGAAEVRSAGPNPLALVSTLRREIPRIAPGVRVSEVHTQEQLIEEQTVRERLLAILGLFFGTVALLLAGVGLYGVLDYSVLQRRREIGIRMALGAQARDIARRVTAEALLMVLLGAVVGLALGIESTRYLETLLFHTKATDPGALALPVLAIALAAAAAALAPVVRAVRIDPATMLRAD